PPSAYGPLYGWGLGFRYVCGYGTPPLMLGSKFRSIPSLTSSHVTGSPPCHFTFGLRVNFQIVLFSLARPVSVARSGTISSAFVADARYVVSVRVVSRSTFMAVARYVPCGSSESRP